MPAEYFLHLVAPRVFPVAAPWDSGLPVDNGSTSPFVVDRGWVGPAGTYIEEWSIRDGDTVLYRHPPSYIQVRGHQAVRRFSDTVVVPIALEPGIYDIIFVVEKYRMGSFVAEAASPAQLAAAAAAAKAPPPAPPQPKAPARPAAPAPAPRAAPATPAAPAVEYTGEAPEVVRERVLAEELAKGSDPRVAQARAKSAEMKAKKAMAAAAAAPAAAPTVAAPAPAPVSAEPVAAAAPAAAKALSRPEQVAADAPPGGGGFEVDEAAVVRTLVYKESISDGLSEEVATARAVAAEIRARRGPWWRPDWK